LSKSAGGGLWRRNASTPSQISSRAASSFPCSSYSARLASSSLSSAALACPAADFMTSSSPRCVAVRLDSTLTESKPSSPLAAAATAREVCPP